MNYVIGKSPDENTRIVENSEPDDIWFHIANTSSAHLVLKNDNKESIENLRKNGVIYQMARALKMSHSKLRKMRDIEVNYTYIKNVTTTSTPGLVTIKKYKSVRV